MKKFLAALIITLVSATAMAQDLVTIVNLGAGSAMDTNSRQVVKEFDRLFGTQSVVINRPGAFGRLGIDHFLTSADPQKTLLFSTGGAIADLPKDKFDQLVPIAEIVRYPFALIVRKDFPANTYKEFVAYARANPGKINVGLQSPSISYPIVVPIEEKGKYKTNYILYAGSTTARPEVDVSNGILDAFWSTPGSVLTSGYGGERVKVLLVTSDTHLPFPGSNITYAGDPLVGHYYSVNTVWANIKMDKRRQEELNTKFNAVVKSQWWQENLAKIGSRTDSGTIEENLEFYVRQRDRIEKFTKKYPELMKK